MKEVKVGKEELERIMSIAEWINREEFDIRKKESFKLFKEVVEDIKRKAGTSFAEAYKNLHSHKGFGLISKYSSKGKEVLSIIFKDLFNLESPSTIHVIESPKTLARVSRKLMKVKILFNTLVDVKKYEVIPSPSRALVIKPNPGITRMLELKEKHIRKIKGIAIGKPYEVAGEFLPALYSYIFFPSTIDLSKTAVLKRPKLLGFGFIETSEVKPEIYNKELYEKLVELSGLVETAGKISGLKRMIEELKEVKIGMIGLVIYISQAVELSEENVKRIIDESNKLKVELVRELTTITTLDSLNRRILRDSTRIVFAEELGEASYANIGIPPELYGLNIISSKLSSIDFKVEENKEGKIIEIKKQEVKKEKKEEIKSNNEDSKKIQEKEIHISSFIRNTIREVFRGSYKEIAVAILAKKIEEYALSVRGPVETKKEKAKLKIESIKRKFDRTLEAIKKELKESGLSNGEVNNAIGNVVVPLILHFQKQKAVIDFINKVSEGKELDEDELKIFEYVKNHPVAWQSLAKLSKKPRLSKRHEITFIDGVKKELSKHFKGELLLAAVHTVRILNAKRRIGWVYLSHETIASDITKATKLSRSEVEQLFMKMIELNILKKLKEGRQGWFGISINPKWLADVKNNKIRN